MEASWKKLLQEKLRKLPEPDAAINKIRSTDRKVVSLIKRKSVDLTVCILIFPKTL